MTPTEQKTMIPFATNSFVAMLCGHSTPKGVVRLLLPATLASLLALTGGLLFTASPANAAVTHTLIGEIKEVPATCVQPSCVTGPLYEQVQGMTVDSGHLLVADSQGERSRIDEFEASSGAFLSQLTAESVNFHPTDKGVAVGHATGETHVYAGVRVEDGGVLDIFSESGALLGTWTGAKTPAKSFGNYGPGAVAGVAVDNGPSPSLSDWAVGDVYVASYEGPGVGGVVNVLDPRASVVVGEETTPVAQLTGTCPSEHTIIGAAGCEEAEVHEVQHFSGRVTAVAVDEGNGDVLVTDEKELYVFRPVEPFPGVREYEFVTRIKGTRGGAFEHVLGAVAVDGRAGPDEGDIYLAEAGPEEGNAVDEFRFAGPADESVEYRGHLTGVIPQSVAVDPASGDVYVGEHGAVKQYGRDEVIPDVATGPVTSFKIEPATHTWGAVLTGTVNPFEAETGEEAKCWFVWGSSASLGNPDAPCSAPVKGSSPVTVEVPLEGLRPDTTYYYRLQAKNGKGTNLSEEPTALCNGVKSVDGCFTTPGPGIEEQSASDVASTSATLNATLNPNNAPTSYYFQYGTSASYEYTAPVGAPPGEVLGSSEGEEVQQHIQGLAAGTIYHYRVVAVGEIAPGKFEEFYGPDATFMTRGTGAFALPDGRQWEMVSPPEKQGALILAIGQFSGEGGVIQSAASGDAITYVTDAPTEAQPAGETNVEQVLSTRGSGGWSTQDISPPHNVATGLSIGQGKEYRFFSEDLSLAIVEPFSPFTSLSDEASENTAYLRTDFPSGDVSDHCEGESSATSSDSCYRPLVSGCPAAGRECSPSVEEHADVPPGTVFGDFSANENKCRTIICGPEFVDASPDASHVILLSSWVQLTSTFDPTGLYEWSGGRLQPLFVLPEGEGGGTVDGGLVSLANDGSVFFSYGDHLYLQDAATGKSVRLDVAQGVVEPGVGGVGSFFYASSDGSMMLFSDSQRLTSAAGGGIYECRIVEVAGNMKCELELTDLESTGVSDGVSIGVGEDASYLYFLGAEDKLYVDRYNGSEWKRTFIAALAGEVPGVSGDGPDWAPDVTKRTSRVSPNGQWLAFMSQRELTGYDNHDAVSGQADEEVYLYDAQTGGLVCASCDPTGSRPHGEKYISDVLASGDRIWEESTWIAANVPGWTPYRLGQSIYQSRYLSDSGRLFFDSYDALVPKDVNGQEDVYEYEPEGVPAGEHACSSSSASGSEAFRAARTVEVEGRQVQEGAGCVALISSGESSGESAFLDASETGGDVFFLTTSRLAPQDTDDNLDIYDAHECTSQSRCFPTPVEEPPACMTEASCKAAPVPQPPVFGLPASATFSGPSNIIQPPLLPAKATKKAVKCSKRRKLAHGKCVKAKAKKKKTRAKTRATKSDRRAG